MHAWEDWENNTIEEDAQIESLTMLSVVCEKTVDDAILKSKRIDQDFIQKIFSERAAYRERSRAALKRRVDTETNFTNGTKKNAQHFFEMRRDFIKTARDTTLELKKAAETKFENLIKSDADKTPGALSKNLALYNKYLTLLIDEVKRCETYKKNQVEKVLKNAQA